MKLSAYIVSVDSGFSPNPFGQSCTLACCKPTIRRNAEEGDIVVGCGSVRCGLSGRLIYAMCVGKILPLQDYWDSYPSKRPSARTPVTRRGDAVWHRDSSGTWRGVRGALHDHRHRERDLRGENALIASEFYYFGRDAIPIPPEFSAILATTQGHKNTHDVKLIDRFWAWISRTARKAGRIGSPSEFTPAGCRAQRTEEDVEDTTCE
jgi:Nucleotide modification associated domain 2